jgi:hypothetical protein
MRKWKTQEQIDAEVLVLEAVKPRVTCGSARATAYRSIKAPIGCPNEDQACSRVPANSCSCVQCCLT